MVGGSTLAPGAPGEEEVALAGEEADAEEPQWESEFFANLRPGGGAARGEQQHAPPIQAEEGVVDLESVLDSTGVDLDALLAQFEVRALAGGAGSGLSAMLRGLEGSSGLHEDSSQGVDDIDGHIPVIQQSTISSSSRVSVRTSTSSSTETSTQIWGSSHAAVGTDPVHRRSTGMRTELEDEVEDRSRSWAGRVIHPTVSSSGDRDARLAARQARIAATLRGTSSSDDEDVSSSDEELEPFQVHSRAEIRRAEEQFGNSREPVLIRSSLPADEYLQGPPQELRRFLPGNYQDTICVDLRPASSTSTSQGRSTSPPLR